MNRLAALAVLALFGAAGCTQSCLRSECGWKDLYAQAQLPPQLECEPASLDALLVPPPPDVPQPATVLEPERTPYYLSLGEAYAVALEHGTVGNQSVRSPGLPNDDLVGFGGSTVFGSDSIRVLALDPARTGLAIDKALSRFDPLFTTGIRWANTDEPLTFNNGDSANFFATLAKQTPTGGTIGATLSTDYFLLNGAIPGGPGSVNPTYIPKVVFGFEQPLLRGFGTEINQILPSIPGSNLFSGLGSRPNGFASEGILLARLRFDEQRADLERSVNYLLLNVEAAYWNLYGAYVNLYATEQGLRQSQQAWVIFKSRADVGQGIGIGQLAQVRAQYEQFRGDRMRAVGTVLNAERDLRQLLGIRVEDGKRLVPVDAPTTAPLEPDWPVVLHDTLNLRPELLMARQELKARQFNLLAQKNFLLPDLRFSATHTTLGLGTRLDGSSAILDNNGFPVTSNALRSLAGAHFNDWTVGLTLAVPLGFRYEHAQLRDARLHLAQGYALLKNQEVKATNFSARSYSRVIETQRVLEIRRSQREAAAEQLRVRSVAFAEGNKQSPVEFLLSAQQQFAFALNQEYQAIVDYNIALATLEFARGTIMRHSKVSIAEAPLPSCAERAVDLEHRRAIARVADRVHHVPPTTIEAPLPSLPLHGAASLLDLGEGPVAAAPAAPMPAPTPDVVAVPPVAIAPRVLPAAPPREAPPMAILPAVRLVLPVRSALAAPIGLEGPLTPMEPAATLSFISTHEPPTPPQETLRGPRVEPIAVLAPPWQLQFGAPSATRLRPR